MKKLLILLLTGDGVLATQTLDLAPTKRLEARVSKNAMNRIQILGDRIAQVFGDEEAYSLQSDDATGQIFIKSAEGIPSLALTLITEKGVTQDVILTPAEISAETLILKSAPSSLTEMPDSLPYQGEILRALKRVWMGKAPVEEELPQGRRTSRKDLMITPLKTYNTGRFKVSVYVVRNASEKLQTLEEKDFFSGGDIAVSLQSFSLKPKATTLLYGVRL